MKQKKEKRRKSKDTLEALKLLIDWHKWTHEIYEKEYRLFLGIESILLGFLATGVIEVDKLNLVNVIVLYIGLTFGLILAIFWAGRQRRQLYFSKAKIEEFVRMENKLPEDFRYFSDIWPHSLERVRTGRSARIPVIMNSLRILPNPFAKSSFMHTVIIQQLFMYMWISFIVLMTLKVYVL